MGMSIASGHNVEQSAGPQQRLVLAYKCMLSLAHGQRQFCLAHQIFAHVRLCAHLRTTGQQLVHGPA